MKEQTFARLLKTTVVLVLVAMLVLSSMPITFAAGKELVGIEIDDIQITQYTGGYLDTVYGDDSKKYTYYRYNCYPEYVTMIYSDGSVKEEYFDDYWFYIYTNQDYDNQWGIGTYTATAIYDDSDSDISCNFNVTITESPIERIEVNDLKIPVYTNGFYESDCFWDSYCDYQEYEYYEYEVDTPVTVYTKDGRSYNAGYSYVEIDGVEYNIQFKHNQSYKNQWTLGNTYEATCYVGGLSQNYSVEIINGPITKIEFDDIEIVEYTNGDEEYDWTYDEYYYLYDIDPQGVVYTDDGGSFEFDSPWIFIDEYQGEYCDIEYHIELSHGQSYKNQWTVGNTYKVTASVAGITDTFNVTITESPIEKIEAESFEVIQYTNGYWDEDWIWDDDCDYIIEEYYRYDTDTTVTVYTKDGKKYTADEDEIRIGNALYYISYSSNQSAKKSWVAGKSYPVTVSVGNYSTEFEVSVVESPVASAKFTTSDQMQDMDGYWDWNYLNGEEVEWFCYDEYYSDITGTLTMKDGSVITIDSYYDDIVYNNKEYDIRCRDNQSVKNQWRVGKNQATVYALGFEATLDVNVIENPVKKVTVEDVTVEYESSGYYDEEDDDSYKYIYTYEPEIIVELKDGTQLTVEDDYVEYNGKYYRCYIEDNQWDEPWGIGKHTVQAEVMGKTVDFTVNVVESKVRSIEIIKVKTIENYEDNYDDDMEEDYDYKLNYYKYNLEYAYKVNYNDGTSKSFANIDTGWVEEYEISGSDIALIRIVNSDNWHVGKGNKFTLRYGGVTIDCYAEVITDESEYKYIEQNGEIVITEYLGEDESITIPDTIDGKKVVGVSADAFPATTTSIVFSDNVRYITGTLSLSSLSYLKLGSGFETITNKMFSSLPNLVMITVSQNNPNYASYSGAIYNKALDTLVVAPLGLDTPLSIPSTAKNIDVILTPAYKDLEYYIDADSKYYKVVDGVTYTSDMKTVIDCDYKKTGDYVMPDTVEKIHMGAFSYSGLSTVKVSKNVTTISYESFQGSDSLTKVELPATVKKISQRAFAYCDSLSDVNLPSGLESIADSAFYTCNLESVNIPDSVKSIGVYAFAGQNDLKTVVIGNGLESISNYAFHYCKNLQQVTLGKNVKRIGQSSFDLCKSLDKLVIKGNKVEVGQEAFSGCPLTEFTDIEKITGDIGFRSFSGAGFKEATISNTVTSIAYNAFGGCKNLANIEIPTTVLNVERFAFDGTAWFSSQKDGFVYLDHILMWYKGEMPKNTTLNTKSTTLSIAENAFLNFKNLTSVKLNNGLKRIGSRAFAGTSIKQLSIPASVEEIGYTVFANCKSLEEINVNENNKYFKSVDGVLYNKDMTELIYCPKRKSSEFEVPASVKKIASYAFENAGLKTITISRPDVELGNLFAGYGVYDLYSLNASHYYAEYSGLLVRCPEDSTAHKYAEAFLLETQFIKAASTVQVGDTDEDGEITILDATHIQRHLARLTTIAEDKKVYADTDRDGEVSILDATQIQRYLAKLVPEL